MQLEELSRINMAESNISCYNEDQDMTLKQKIDDVINEIKQHNESTSKMYSDKDGSLNKTVLRSQNLQKPKNQKFMNYVLKERKTQN